MPNDHAEPDLQELIEVEGLLEAEIIKARLVSFGIPAVLSFESAGRLFGITMDGIGKVRVMVPRNRLAEAQELLSRDECSGEDDPSPEQN